MIGLNAIGRGLAAALIGALVGAAWAAVFYAWHSALIVDFDRDLPRNVSGIYEPERDDASGLTFAWTSDDAAIRLPGLDRRVAWTLTVRLRGGRSAPAVNPSVTILCDGAELQTVASGNDFQDVTITLPRRPDHRGALVGLRSSSAFVPGPRDPRRLGVMLDRLALVPAGVVLVPRPALDAAALSSAAMGAAIALLGVTPGSAIGAAVVLGAADAGVLTRGFGPFTNYPSLVTRLAWWIALALAAGAVSAQAWRRQPRRNTARFAAAVSAAALFLKLLVLLHPNMPIGDAMFHAHRFEGVLAGNLYFTSVAPGGYQFPYPPGFYVFASIFSGLTRRASDMALLRIVAASADAAAALLLYAIVVRCWGSRLAGAMTVAIYHLMPLSFAVLATANLTNAFAQTLALVALALMVWPLSASRRLLPAAALTAVLAAAFLSHTGTLAILFAAAILIGLLFVLRGDGGLRRTGWLIVASTIAAATFAVAIYYAHFMSTYRTEFARIGRETAAAAPDAGGHTIRDRLLGVPYSLGITIGTPVLLLAFLGGTEMGLRRRGDRLALALGGWTLACVLFLALGVATPVDMRYYLASLPAVAIAAGYGAAWAWNDGWPGHRMASRAAAALLLAASVWAGFHAWWRALG
jgi:hypothetical protein